MSSFVCYDILNLTFQEEIKMKKIIYVYTLDAMAEWEITNLLQVFSMEAMLNKGTKNFEIKTVAIDKKPVKTIGGLTIVPDCTLEEMDDENAGALILPGAENWAKEEHKVILEKALIYIEKGILVGALCGATLALAELSVLDRFRHTSNAMEYLTMFSKQYRGQELYVDSQAVIDKNLVTASAAGGLLFAKHIVKHLNLFSDSKIELWYNYYLTGKPEYLMKLISE